MEDNQSEQKAIDSKPFAQPYFHKTKAGLKVADLIELDNNLQSLTTQKLTNNKK